MVRSVVELNSCGLNACSDQIISYTNGVQCLCRNKKMELGWESTQYLTHIERTRVYNDSTSTNFWLMYCVDDCNLDVGRSQREGAK